MTIPAELLAPCDKLPGHLRAICRGEHRPVKLDDVNKHRASGFNGKISPLPPLPRVVHRMSAGGMGGFGGSIRMGSAPMLRQAGDVRPRPPAKPPAKLGDALEGLLRSMKIQERLKPEVTPKGAPCAPCVAMKARLNNLSIDDVRAKADEFAQELRERASEDYSTWDWMKAATAAGLSGLAFKISWTDPFRSLILLACDQEESRIEALAAVADAATPPTEGN